MKTLYYLCGNIIVFTKNLWLLATFLLFSLQVSAQCPSGNLNFTSQAQVDAFATNYPNCTEFQGYLNINGTNISNLDGLSALTIVGGDFNISNNFQLTNLDGLSALTTVGGVFTINNNNSITNLDGLSALTTVEGSFSIRDNSELINLDGLNALATVGESFSINYNSALNNLDGLSTLTTVGANLTINANPQLTNLDGLSALTTVGGLSIINNSTLTNLHGLSTLTTVGGNLSINTNSQLTNLDGLNALTNMGGNLNINDNSQLTNLDGFNALTDVGGYLYINSNSQLTDISGLANINSDSGLYILYNPALSVCHIESVCTYLQGSGYRVIEGNAIGCQDENAILSSCIFPCEEPTGITATNIVSDKAIINWASDGELFDLEWGTAGFTPGTGTTENGVSAFNYQITGLSATTSYDVYVRQNCTANQSDWVKHTFTTIAQCPSGDVQLYSQTAVNNFGANYPNCTAIAGQLWIQGNSITDLSPLSNIQSTGGLLHVWSTSVTNVNALSNITSVGNMVDIYNNPLLTDLNGLSSLATIGGFLTIHNNPLLTDLTGLSALTSIGSYLNIDTNENLENLNALSSLTNINGKIDIWNNENLTDISGLTNINTGITELRITNNSTLATCNITSVCNYLQGSGPRTISGNAGNCYESAVTDACLGIINYCTPVADSETPVYGGYINSFTTTEGVTNINNVSSGYSANGYGNFSTIHSVSQNASETISFSTVPANENLSKGLRIWVDKNNDGVFDANEIVYASPSINEGTHNGVFTVPSIVGNYRMRVMIKYNTNVDIDPCEINSGTPYDFFLGETEDYTLTVLPELSCPTPTNAIATNITISSATIQWTNSGTFDLEWGTAGFTQGTGTAQNGIIGTSHNLSGLDAETSYDVYVRHNCESEQSNWKKITFSTSNYCIPVAYSDSLPFGMYINSFTTTGGFTNINNANSGFSTNGYGNFLDTHSVIQTAGDTISFIAVSSTGLLYQEGVRIWIDQNKDGAFNTDEIVYTSPSTINGTHYGSFVTPTIEAGNYRMRVMIMMNTIEISPCQTSFFGEAEDYTLTVLPILACPTPTNVIATDITVNSATINWTSDGDLFELEWGTTGFTQGTGTIENGITATSHNLSGLDLGTSYDVYVRQDCQIGQSYWRKLTFSTLDYCTPISYTDSSFNGIYINSFTTTGGVTDINNTNSGYSTNGYSNFSAIHSVSQNAGDVVSFSVVPGSETYLKRVRIWIDQNKDGIFGADEIVYTSPSSISGTHNGSFPAPTIEAGNYRMRVMIKLHVNDILDACEVNLGSTFYGEAEDYTLIVLPDSACPTPTDETATDITINSATINWTSTGSLFDIEWGTAGFTQGTGTTENGIIGTSYNLSGLDLGTSYDVYIRQDCGSEQSYWRKLTFSTSGYCIPIANSLSLTYGIHINSFITTEGITNINNINSGFSTNGYGNFSTTHSVSQNAGDAISFSVVPGNQNNSKGVRIWIDQNKDGVFGSDEIVYTSPSSINGTHNGSFVIPIIDVGNYRMRIMIKLDTNANIDPCEINLEAPYYNNFYGEAEDYTLTVLPNLACPTPTNVITTDITVNSATVNWTSDGDLFDLEWGVAGFTQGTGTTENGITATSYNLSGLDTDTSYDVYVRQDCGIEQSYWRKLTSSFSTLGYCTPVANSESSLYGRYINSFTTTGGITDINNINSGFSTNGYGDFSSTHSVSQNAGDGISFSVVPEDQNSLKIVGIWIDQNKDGIFGEDEIVFISSSGLPGTQSWWFTIPTIETGNYRMRVMIKSSFTANIDPCEINLGAPYYSDFYGEAEDYTLTVLPPQTCPSQTVWNGATWSHGTPNINKRAIINNNLIIFGTMTACELVLNSGTLHVTSNAILIVNGEIVNTQSASNFIIHNGGVLLQQEEVENTGEITVLRNSSPMKRLDYTLWSAPVSGMLLKDFSDVSPTGGNGTLWNRVYTLSESSWEQVWATQSAYQADQTNTFTKAKAYLYRSRNDYHSVNTVIFEGEFKGVPNNGNINIAVPYLFNAIGNPYPSPVSADDLLLNGANALYFWTNANAPVGGNYTLNNWATYNSVGGATASNSTKLPDGIIQTGQGFVIGFESTDSNRTLTFNNSMRLTEHNGQFYRQMSNEMHRYWLNLSDEEVNYNQILVGYLANATQDYDTGIDARMFSYEGNAIYSIIEDEDEKFVIQGRSLPFEESDVVKLGFRAINTGNYSISLDSLDGTFESDNLLIYLKDNFSQTQHNLKESAYSFVSDEGEFDNRFEVVYQTTMSIENPHQNHHNWVVYTTDNGYQILTDGFSMQSVSLYDMLGRTVYTSNAEGTSHLIPNFEASGVYIVRIITSENQVLNKKVK